ncbi:fructosamine kinase family protein [Deinococcus ruber]|uniref:Aminoglycoside phosphotransferase n=1 Tax=Deinococcus ruber TaxID=1848197 RepID=A0A918CGZ5_9DEIO|nr:fructosamine kinase family protein [Deinococcus ruber]GGR23739.1 aminoglycoside phosphotransferase [Deinococcus ruber]
MSNPSEQQALLQAVLLDRQIDDARDTTLLTGGMVNDVWMVTRISTERLVIKTAVQAPPSLYDVEAEGLCQLRDLGGVRTPEVLGVGPSWLVLEACLSADPADRNFWARLGRATAGLHGVQGDRFGWHRDGWLGLLPQRNPWTEDGHTFFAEQRLLRYLPEPNVEALLSPQDRRAIEHLCARLPELIPAGPPSLTHGDFWPNNIVMTADGTPVFLDPAVSWMWPEVDLGMMHYVVQAVPEFAASAIPVFVEAYQDVRPLEPGWQTRAPLMFLRELLSMLAHEGDVWDCVARIRDIIRPFA